MDPRHLQFLAEMRAVFMVQRPTSHILLTGIVDSYYPNEPCWGWTRHTLGTREAERDKRRYGQHL